LHFDDVRDPLLVTYDIGQNSINENVSADKQKITNERRNQFHYLLLALGATLITKSTYGINIHLTAQEFWMYIQAAQLPTNDRVWVLTLVKGVEGNGTHDEKNWFRENKLD
jgi:hypothetical protein